jgi:very-short-patch-repair endonuclease
LETLVRVWLIDRGVAFHHHAAIPGVGEVDFLIGDSLILETDGKIGHDDAAGRARDYRRDTAAAIQGYVTVRFSYEQIMFYWARCEAQIVEHLSRGDHRRRIR